LSLLVIFICQLIMGGQLWWALLFWQPVTVLFTAIIIIYPVYVHSWQINWLDWIGFSAECLSQASNFSDLTTSNCHSCTMIHLVECVSVCVCLHDNLKTIADIYFLLSSYVDWRKISDEFARQSYRWRSSSFFRGWRSLGKIMSYSIMSSEIPSPTA